MGLAWSDIRPRCGGPRPCPELSTERLTLGPLRLSDWEPYLTVLSSDRAAMLGGPYDAFASWGWFNVDMGGWDVTGSGSVALRENGVLRGFVSLNDFPMFPEVEMGWILLADAEGQGFATEAGAAFKAWIKAEVRPLSLVSYIDPQNAGSIGVATRLGAAHDPKATGPSPDDLVYRHWGPA